IRGLGCFSISDKFKTLRELSEVYKSPGLRQVSLNKSKNIRNLVKLCCEMMIKRVRESLKWVKIPYVSLKKI
ncbi:MULTISPECIES: hypothetical protein, partial [Bacillus cereus group]|uniref:hypothetical protein n=1 Tax=Bacillus cereus group TaxID=86661 RepID=UPI000BECC3BB